MNILNKFIGELEPTIETTINDTECLENKRSIILKVDSMDKVKAILGIEFEALQEWMPDQLTLKRFYKEYPALPLFKNEMDNKGKYLEYPDMFYYGKGKPLVIEIKETFYLFSPMKY